MKMKLDIVFWFPVIQKILEDGISFFVQELHNMNNFCTFIVQYFVLS